MRDMAARVTMIDEHEANRRHWDEITPVHLARGYGLEAFLAGRNKLGPVERAAVGDVRGKTLLHLQCHFGMDTLSWARLGASVVGVDFSPVAIGAARRLAEQIGLAGRARFVESDVLELDQVLEETFDVVFTSHGTVGWLSDIERWGRARHLKPDGFFYFIDNHPTGLLFKRTADSRFCLAYDYFHTPEPLIEPPGPDYAVPDYVASNVPQSYIWSLADILGALERAGLTVFELREYPFNVWRQFPGMSEDANGYLRLEDVPFSLPLLLSFKARWPASG
jgi:SAM-dependent methyltransferase